MACDSSTTHRENRRVPGRIALAVHKVEDDTRSPHPGVETVAALDLSSGAPLGCALPDVLGHRVDVGVDDSNGDALGDGEPARRMCQCRRGLSGSNR